MDFVLIEKLAELEGVELIMLIAAVAISIALLVAVVRCGREKREEGALAVTKTQALVYGALCVSLSFMLSYIKLFSMPLGGSVTLCSMLPIVMYASWFGSARGFTAAFAYGVLQVIQGAYIVHWAQFILDYFVAFTCLGLASLFPRKLPLGMAVSGFARLLCSVVSGVVFFASSAADAGWASAWGYSFAYNGATIGVDTLVCVIVALIPAVAGVPKRVWER